MQNAHVCAPKAETFMHVTMQNLQHGYHTQITAGQQKTLINTMLYVRPLIVKYVTISGQIDLKCTVLA